MEKKVTMIDPPSGWRYGFPKPIPEDRKKDVIPWLIEQGYPKKVIDSFGEHFACRYWDENEQAENPLKDVTRFEVIDHSGDKPGRVLVKHGISVEMSIQDDGKTLKIFISDENR